MSKAVPRELRYSPARISYQVPKEVGKVGTESPTFVEPISERRDGIQAMFAKQAEAKISGSKSQTSPHKRKRRNSSPNGSQFSSSPRKKVGKTAEYEVIDLCGDEPVPGRRAGTEKMNTWEDSSDIEYVDQPAEREKSKVGFVHTVSAMCLMLGQTPSASQPKKTVSATIHLVDSIHNITDGVQNTPKKNKKSSIASGTPKITKFFGKA